MAFGLLVSRSALVPMITGALFDFSVPTTVRSVRVSNTQAFPVTLTLYFDYDGTGTNTVDIVLPAAVLAAQESALLDGGPWDFAANSRISGVASVGNSISVHITPASI